MKVFRFSLENVLHYRQALEEQSKLRLARAMDDLQREKVCLKKFQGELAARQQGIPEGPLEVDKLLLQTIYLEALAGSIMAQNENVTKATARVGEEQKATVTAMQQRRVLDNLKARRRAEYDYTAGREEQNQLDEAGASAFVRNRLESNNQET